VLSAAALVLAILPAAVGQELTEKQLIERVFAESPQVRVLQAAVAAARAESLGRTLYPNPAASYVREGAGFTEFLQFEQPLVLTNRRGYLRKAGSAAVSAADLLLDRNLWEMRTGLRLAFYRLLEEQERHKIVERSISELEEIVRILRRRETEGEGSRFDRLRAERELVEARADRVSADVSLAHTRGELAAFLSFADIQNLRAGGSFARLPPAPSIDPLVKRSLENRQDYVAEKSQLDRYLNERRAAERLRVPDPVVTLGLKRSEGFPDTRNGSVFAVTVPIPLFNRGQAESDRAQVEYERTQARIEALERRIRADVAAAHGVFELRRTLAEQYRLQTERSGKDLVRIAQLAYEEGEKSILELLDVYRVSRQTELRALELLAAMKQAQIELDRAVGEEVFP
jgi:cobalt-zinc-cadmium efflux system outer membrane protein